MQILLRLFSGHHQTLSPHQVSLFRLVRFASSIQSHTDLYSFDAWNTLRVSKCLLAMKKNKEKAVYSILVLFVGIHSSVQCLHGDI